MTKCGCTGYGPKCAIGEGLHKEHKKTWISKDDTPSMLASNKWCEHIFGWQSDDIRTEYDTRTRKTSYFRYQDGLWIKIRRPSLKGYECYGRTLSYSVCLYRKEETNE